LLRAGGGDGESERRRQGFGHRAWGSGQKIPQALTEYPFNYRTGIYRKDNNGNYNRI